MAQATRFSGSEWMGRWLRGAVSVSFVVATVAGCAWHNPNAARWDEMTKASDEYNKLIRWKELDTACTSYAEASIREKCLEKASASKDLSVTNVHTRDIDFKIDNIDATVNVEIEYYVLPSTKVRTILDAQQWRYMEKEGKKVWQIRSLLPDFDVPR